MTNLTYGRGQAEWALWNSFIFGRGVSDGVPQVFKTRIKRLLDVDRESEFAEASVPPPVRWSFVSPPETVGAEASYSTIDVFCLAIGLDLLDTGFKQSEVVFLLRYLRPELEARMPEFLSRLSLLARRLYKPEVDPRQFVVLSKIEIREIAPPINNNMQETPLILEPYFCDGIEALSAHLSDAMPQRRRIVTVFEIVATAQAVAMFLDEAPNIHRGRPRHKLR